ncbi:hypothetical protein ANO11243_072370 [Dothideomycetidae sp. 11243]|nr:hypothetical protein ANO11243_072370 [fungal sp. No.11243]
MSLGPSADDDAVSAADNVDDSKDDDASEGIADGVVDESSIDALFDAFAIDEDGVETDGDMPLHSLQNTRINMFDLLRVSEFTVQKSDLSRRNLESTLRVFAVRRTHHMREEAVENQQSWALHHVAQQKR